MKNTDNNFYWLAGLMTTLALVVMAVSYYILWITAIEQKRTDLVHIAQSQARLIEAIARFDQRHNRIDWETPIGERGPTSLFSIPKVKTFAFQANRFITDGTIYG